MTYAEDLFRKFVLLSIIIVVNGFSILDDIQNGYHAEKQAYVGQYFRAIIDFGSEKLCNLSRLQVSEAYSHEQPSWLVLNASSSHLYGIPKEDDVGTVILLITAVGSNTEGQEFICNQLVWKITIELDPSSLVLALSQYIENRTRDQNGEVSLQRCLSHPTIIIASLSISLKLGASTDPLVKLADLIADTLHVSKEIIQVTDGSSSFAFHKQLKNLRILRYENVLKPDLSDNLYHVSWPIGCEYNDVSIFDIHKLHRRSLSSVTDVKLNSWHLTSGSIDGEVHARKRRAVFFGSITALEGTPLETSTLPTSFLTSAIFTSISSVDTTNMVNSTRVFPTFSLNTSNTFVQANDSIALSSLPTTKLAFSQAPGSTRSVSSFDMLTQTISSYATLSLGLHSSQSTLLTSTSTPSIGYESTYKSSLLSSFPPVISESSIHADQSSLHYFATSLPHSPSFVQSTCASGNCAGVIPSSEYLESKSTPPLASMISSLFFSTSTLQQGTSTLHMQSPSYFQSETTTFVRTGSILTENRTSSLGFSSTRTLLYSITEPPSLVSTRHKSMILSTPAFSTGFSPSRTDIKNITSQPITMQLTTLLPSTSPIYAESSSQYYVTPSVSISYQHSSTRDSSIVSIVPSSITVSFASSGRNMSDITSQTISAHLSSPVPSMSIAYVRSSFHYSETTSFSVPYQRSSTDISSFSSMAPRSLTTSFASSRQDINNTPSQSTKIQLTSLLSSVSTTISSIYSQYSVVSTAEITQGSSSAKVESTLTSQLKSLASAYSSIQSNIYSRPKSSTLAPSRSDFISTGSTSTLLSYIFHSAATYLSSSVLPTGTALTSKVIKSASELFSTQTPILSTTVVKSAEHISSFATDSSQYRITTAFLKSPLMSFSSRFSLASSAFGFQLSSTLQSAPIQSVTILGSLTQMRISTIAPPSSYFNTYQSLTAAASTTNLTLISSPVHPSSISSAVVSTQVPNTNPILVNSIGRVTAYVGRLLVFKIPFDTFYDAESGYTPNLIVSCRYASGQPLEKSYWIVFDNKTQTLSGLPLVDEFNKQGSVGARLEVIAMDRFGGSARDVFNVYIENTAVDIQFSLTARISKQFNEFQTDSSLKVTLFNRIIRFYNTSATSSYYASSLTNGSVLFSWSDTTISGSTCNQSAITKIVRYVQMPSGSVTSAFAQAMLPDFPVLGLTLSYHGACLVAPTTPAAPLGPAAGERVGDIFTRYVVPTIAVAVVLALIIGAVIFLSKRRRRKPSFLEKRTFRKGRPVLLPEEYELDGMKSPVVSLPEDYIFSNAEDGHSVYSHGPSEKGDEDEETYMDNPLYGLSEFKKPPPLYYKDQDNDDYESYYESPYSRPPPSYQLPPFYKDEEIVTSEV